MKKFFFIIIIVFFLPILTRPVFADVMKSNNYRLQLEPSDIKAIPQDFTDNPNSVNDFKKALDTGNITSNISSNNTNHKLIKVVLIGLLMISLIIFYFKRIKTKFGIKRKNNR